MNVNWYILFSFLFFQAQVRSQKLEVSLNKQLSSKHSEYAPRFFGENDRYLMFTSNRQVFNGYENENIFFSENSNGKWKKAIELIKNKSNANYGVITVDNKRNVAFFTMCPIVKGKRTHCSIYYSFLSGGMIGEILPLNIPFDAEIGTFNIGQPYFSNEMNLLFFAARMPGGYGGTDIWYSKYDGKTDSWSKATNMGPEINSPKDELYPFVDEKGSIYFTSKRDGGLGGMDLYVSKLIDTVRWSEPKNLNEPLNSDKDDFGITFKKGSVSGYFSSNRSGGLGGDDIYDFHLENSPIEYSTPSQDSIKYESDLKKALSSIFNKESCSDDVGVLCINKLRVIPNPNNGEFNTEFYCNKDANLKIRIYSSGGQLLSLQEINIVKGITTRSYDLKHMAKGIYYLSVLFGCEILTTEKVIIQ